MHTRIWGLAVLLAVGAVCSALADAKVAPGPPFEIPKQQLDVKRIYLGQATQFDKPGEINFLQVLKSTPEWAEIEKRKIERGTGRFWILANQAADRVRRAVYKLGESTDYDFIAAKGYLGSLDPKIPADDLTNELLDTLHGKKPRH